MIRKHVVIANDQDDASKLASKLVRKAGKFASLIWIESGSKRVNAKSIMGVLSMHLIKDSSFDLICTGDDEEKAIQALEDLFADGE